MYCTYCTCTCMYSKCVQMKILETVDKTYNYNLQGDSRHLLCNILPLDLSPVVSWLVPLAETLGGLGGQ